VIVLNSFEICLNRFVPNESEIIIGSFQLPLLFVGEDGRNYPYRLKVEKEEKYNFLSIPHFLNKINHFEIIWNDSNLDNRSVKCMIKALKP